MPALWSCCLLPDAWSVYLPAGRGKGHCSSSSIGGLQERTLPSSKTRCFSA